MFILLSGSFLVIFSCGTSNRIGQNCDTNIDEGLRQIKWKISSITCNDTIVFDSIKASVKISFRDERLIVNEIDTILFCFYKFENKVIYGMPKRFYLKNKGVPTVISDRSFAKKVSNCCSLEYTEEKKRSYVELDYSLSRLLSGFFNIESLTPESCILFNSENKTRVSILATSDK